MKKVFEDDQSYMEIVKKGSKLVITLCGKDSPGSLDVIMVSVEMDEKEFKEMVKKL